jgi:tetratricopeptide (TPR) repeat protein
VTFAHQVAKRFPDGQLYLDLRGHDPRALPLSPAQALGLLLRSLGTDTARLPHSADELAGHYRSALAGKRVLVVLDNAASTGQVRPLLPGHPGCLALITSRSSLSGLVARDGAQRTILGPLGDEDALDLLARILGTARVAREPEAAGRIAKLCGCLPLALRIAAERATARPDVPLTALADELADERMVLSALAVQDDETTGVRAAFSWSYRALPTQQARFFRLLGLHTGPVFTAAATAALAGIEPAKAERLLSALTSVHLVDQLDEHRFRLHDLVRVYAAECAAQQDPAEEQHAAIERVASWYLHTAHAAAKTVRPARRHADLGNPPSNARPLSFDDYDDALAWLDAEHANCSAAAQAARQHGLDRLACAFPGALFDVFSLRGLLDEWDQTIDSALAAARSLGDAAVEATLLSNLAIVRARAARHEEALALLETSLNLRRETGDRRGEAATLGNIGNTLNELGRSDEALEYIRQAAALHHETGDLLGEAMSFGNMGQIHERQNRPAEMIVAAERALPLFHALADRPGEARLLSNLASAYVRLSDNKQAVAYAERALSAARACGARDIEALALRDLGRAHFEQADPASARDCWRRSFDILDELGDPVAEELRGLLEATAGVPGDTSGEKLPIPGPAR